MGPLEADVSLKVEGISKRYGSVRALEEVSFELETGSFGVLLGPSGSGKTSLLRVIAGLEVPDQGSVEISGTAVVAPGLQVPPERRQLAMVFQDYALWPHLSVLHNVALPLRERRVQRWREAAQQALEAVGLLHLKDRFPYQLSGGQQQRVALARALAIRPKLLLFDEPLSNLDARLREELRLLILNLVRQERITALYITHDQQEAFFLADRLGVMREGKLLQWGRPEEIYACPRSAFVAEFTRARGGFLARVEEGRLCLADLELEVG